MIISRPGALYSTAFAVILLSGFPTTAPAQRSVPAAPAAYAQPVTAAVGAAAIEAVREDGDRLRVDIRLRGGARLESVSATLAGTDVVLESLEPYPSSQAISSFLILVDTSDPARQAVIARHMEQIERVLSAAQPHHRFGLAIFDSDLVMLIPPGSGAEEVGDALAGVIAGGRTTELFRSTMSAITRVGIVPAARKAIFLFSDGLAQDTAYKAEDVIAAGRAADVTIVGFGLPRSPGQAPLLRNIRRLAENTGGLYFEADENGTLPDAALTEPFLALDAGGTALFGMTPETSQAGGMLHVRLETDRGPVELNLRLAALPMPPREPWRVWIDAPSNQAIVALGLVFLSGLAAIAITNVRRRRAIYRKRLADGHFDEPEAWLEYLDGDGRRVDVRGSAFRIGRNRDNDLVLANGTVSGEHAVIFRSGDGGYGISGVGAAGSITVNLSQTSSTALNNGDIVELGDARFRFRMVPRAIPASTSDRRSGAPADGAQTRGH